MPRSSAESPAAAISSRVLAGIDAAVAAGLRVKTNAVALAEINDDELVALCEDAWARGAVPRFIEHMPMSDGALFDAGKRDLGCGRFVARSRPRSARSCLRERRGATRGPARYWTLAGRRKRSASSRR